MGVVILSFVVMLGEAWVECELVAEAAVAFVASAGLRGAGLVVGRVV